MLVNISMMTSIPGVLGPSGGEQASYAKLTKANGACILEYGTSLWHLIYNEYNNANLNPEAGRLFARLHRPGPYNFQTIGGEAFQGYAQTVELINPWTLLKVSKHRV